MVVCTANQCRSPLAAAVLQARLDARMLPVSVTSTGCDAADGTPATPPTVLAARRLPVPVDLSAHRSRRVDPAAVRQSALIVTMERRHVQEVVVVAPDAFGRTFTLKELVRRGDEVGARAPDEALDAWLARLHEGRRPIDLLGASPDDDVADPTVSPLVGHDAMATEVVELVDALVALAWPPTA
jgi:protein-tyrosine-phosphatase